MKVESGLKPRNELAVIGEAEASLPTAMFETVVADKAETTLPTAMFETAVVDKAEATLPTAMLETVVADKAGATLPRFYHLPHIDLVGHYQFITFRTFDSVDDFVKKLSASALSNAKKQLAVDAYLDESPNGAYLSGESLDFLSDFLKSKDGVLYELVAFAIMSNHVHLLIKPMAGLSQVMQAIKGASAKTINSMLGKSGKFWADGYYDKLIRDDKHFATVYEYIKNNPLKKQNRSRGFSPAEVADGVFGAEAPIPRCELTLIGGAEAPIPKRFYGKFEIDVKENV